MKKKFKNGTELYTGNPVSIVDIEHHGAIYVDAKERSKWISVKDQLPEKRGLYLCYYKYEPDSPNVICENTYLGSGLWQSEMSKITHWMPIPEPPEEDKKR